MAPIRKSKDLNKLSAIDSKESSLKHASNGDKTRKLKRKTPDMSGSQWSKDELGHFYEAYRKYGKNWKKVSGFVGTRSVEMVEALYNLNKAYLSLPEGVATVVGLIAMMSDHYATLASDGSERENSGDLKISQIQKRDRVNNSKSQAGHNPHFLHSQAVASNPGCLSGLKIKCSIGNGPRTVGKRTPRFPVSHPCKKDEVRKYNSPSKRNSDSEVVIANEVAQGVLALTKNLQGEGSSRKSNSRTEHVRLSLVRDRGKIHADTETVGHKHIAARKGNTWGGKRIKGSGNAITKKKRNLQDMRSGDSDARDTCKTNKRRKRLLSEDESFALDALNTLAYAIPEIGSTPVIETGHKENITNHAMAGDDSDLDVGLVPEAKPREQSDSRMKKRKHKSLSSKILKTEPAKISVHNKPQKTEGKSIGPQEPASPRGDLERQENQLAQTILHDSTAKQVNLPKKLRSKHTVHPPKPLIESRMKALENLGNGQPSSDYSASLPNSAHCLKEKFSHCISVPTLQRWCSFEWFYSSIDFPWFAKGEFVEYLNHVGLGHVPKLTRVEWGVIRSSLGKPRRLSQQFLTEEKDKLERYRESVRAHYRQLRYGTMDAIPSDLARPLHVGQPIFARHPKTREICNGRILTVESEKCRVQFDHLELGVELVMDIDCMRQDLMDNMPEALRKQSIPLEKDQENFSKSIHANMVGQTRCAQGENLENADDSFLFCPPAHHVHSSLKLAKGCTVDETSQHNTASNRNDNAREGTKTQPCNLVQNQSRDADIQALSDLRRALDKKELLVSELRYMNCEVYKNQNDGDESLKDSELFKKQYASVLLQLREANDQVSSALLFLKQRNTYQENVSRPWLKPVPRSSSSAELHNHFHHSAFPSQNSGSKMLEVVEISRLKAQKMVDAAAQAMSSLKNEEDAYMKILETLGHTNGHALGVDSSIPVLRSVNASNPYHHDVSHLNQSAYNMADRRTTDQAVVKLNNASEATKVQVPSALISSCVATLLMIQTCTDRHYPPAEAAEILQSAITSLQPCCSQNVSIYREIQMCMGMVKNQILALIPT